MRMFYVNVEMAPGTPLDQTLKQVEVIEAKVRKHLQPDTHHTENKRQHR